MCVVFLLKIKVNLPVFLCLYIHFKKTMMSNQVFGILPLKSHITILYLKYLKMNKNKDIFVEFSAGFIYVYMSDKYTN